jgi:hypothetical protein
LGDTGKKKKENDTKFLAKEMVNILTNSTIIDFGSRGGADGLSTAPQVAEDRRFDSR